MFAAPKTSQSPHPRPRLQAAAAAAAVDAVHTFNTGRLSIIIETCC